MKVEIIFEEIKKPSVEYECTENNDSKNITKKNIFEKLKHFFNPGYNVLTYIRKKLGN